MGNLASALDELEATDWASRSGPELAEAVVELTEATHRLAATRLAALAAFDASGEWAIEGSLSAGAWVAGRCRLRPAQARSEVKLGGRLTRMPETSAALAEGAISVDHARAIAVAEGHDRFAEGEGLLVEAARSVRPDDLRGVVLQFRAAIGDERLRDLPGLRRLHVSESFEAMTVLDGLFEAGAGAVIRRAVDQAMAAAPDTPGEPPRTRPQQRADALEHVCDHYLRCENGPRRHRPHVIVTVDLETLEGRAGRPARTTDGHTLTGDALRRFACDAEITRVITGPDSRPLDLGRTTRTVPDHLRTALVARDAGCVYPGCDRPPESCDADHVVAWWAGGPTDLANLALLCTRHHTLKHRGVFRVRPDPAGGRPHCTTPDGDPLGGRAPP